MSNIRLHNFALYVIWNFPGMMILSFHFRVVHSLFFSNPSIWTLIRIVLAQWNRVLKRQKNCLGVRTLLYFIQAFALFNIYSLEQWAYIWGTSWVLWIYVRKMLIFINCNIQTDVYRHVCKGAHTILKRLEYMAFLYRNCVRNHGMSL